jgi:hypothetical protein
LAGRSGAPFRRIRRNDGDGVIYLTYALAVLVDDPEGDPDGRPLRRILGRLDVIAAVAEVRRVPAWRCLAEPEQVVT